jgi:hypothetical protein
VANTGAEKRRERLAAALRENLRRRKAHKRGAGKITDQGASPARGEASTTDSLSHPKSPR